MKSSRSLLLAMVFGGIQKVFFDDLDFAFSLVFSFFVGLGALLTIGGTKFFILFAEITPTNCTLVLMASAVIACVSGVLVYRSQKSYWAATEVVEQENGPHC